MNNRLIHIFVIGVCLLVLSACNHNQEELLEDNTKKFTENQPSKEDSDTNLGLPEQEIQSEDYKAGETIPKEKVSDNYELTSMNYIYNDLQVYYPQLSSGLNKTKREEINEIIQNDVLDMIKQYPGLIERVDEVKEGEAFEFDLTVDYEITFQSKEYLSIYYIADYTSKSGPYPSIAVFTTNIDIPNSKKMKLSNMISMDKDFALFLKGWNLTAYEEDNKDLNDALNEYFQNISNEDLYNGLINADQIGTDNTMGIYSYLTKDSFGINVSVPHVLGDFVRFEMEYKNLDGYLKTKNEKE